MDESSDHAYSAGMTGPDKSTIIQTDIAIIGAGPAGTSLAILTARAGFRTVLIDARDLSGPARKDSRTFAIVRGNWRMLGAVGVAEDLADLIQPLNGLEAIDGGKHLFGAPSVLFTNDDLPDDADAEPLGQMVPAGALQAALDKRLDCEPNLIHLTPAFFESITHDAGKTRLTLRNGRQIEASLAAGCDGVNSPLRGALGIAVEGRSYGKSVFAADVQLERPHEGIARQLFTPEGPFATLPMPGNGANLAWYMKTGAAEAMAAMDKSDIETELNARFADFAGPMQLIGKPLAYPLIMKVTTSMIGPRAALVGDAAHRINPLAGQGLNLGLKDVAALVEVINDARRLGLDIGSAVTLERYQQWRRFDAVSTALAMDAVDIGFSNDSALLKPLRGLALSAASKIAPLRHALARQASADKKTLPKLLRGEAL